jgi:hypothetical protein
MRGFVFARLRIGRAAVRLTAAALLAAVFAGPPARAFDLFATHEVTAHFATPGGTPMANAEVRVFAPGNPETPVATGRTDATGKFVFAADRDGMWSAEARTPGEIARISIRVGSGSSHHPRFNPLLMIGALALLLVGLFWYRLRRLRITTKR